MNKAKLRMWWDDNWLKLVLWLIGIISVIGLLAGMYVFIFELESFQKQSMLASVPIYIFSAVISTVIFLVGYPLIMNRGFTKMSSQKKKLNVELINIKFSDVIGLGEAKREALEVVSLIQDRALVKKIGGKIVKGILMQGPPGCGKTLLAKAIASETGLPFLSISGSEFVEVFVGVGASRVRELMRRARMLAEAHGGCIIFIDELDVIGRARSFSAFGASEETNSTQNELLVQMDGLQTGTDRIIFIGATNAAESTLDPALLRPGRFDRKIYVGKPHLKEREDLFRYYLAKINADPNLDMKKLAQRSVDKSPADIEACVKESALIAARESRDMVILKDLSQAFERIDLGIAHRLPMTAKDREWVATHEAGHLVAAYNLHPTHDVFKATILHRGGVLGHVLPVPREEQIIQSKDELIANIKMYLAGFLSERIKYGTTGTGASSDFAAALRIAQSMVWDYGMGPSGVIGNYSITQSNNRVHSTMSEVFKDQLTGETQAILKQCEKETEEFLRKEWDMVLLFANLLIEKEELNYDEIEDVFAQHGKARVREDQSTNV